MPITAVCPECETRYQLEDNLLGKRISCPTCKAVFHVESLSPPVSPKPVAADPKESRNQSGKIEDFVPLLNEVEVPTPIEEVWSPEIEPPQVGESLPKPIEQTSPPEVTTPKPTQEKRRKASKVEEPASPSEETWTPESSPPQVEEYQEPVKPIYEESRSLPVKRKKRSSYRVPALIAMVLFILGSIGVGGVYLKRYMDLAPDRLYQTATDEYTASHFDQARKLFEQLAREYPSHPKAGEAKFFTELAGLRTGVGSVVNRSNPQPALDQWKQFLETIKQPDLASFAERDRYGFDIWQGGSKLAEDLVGKGEDSFDREKPEDSETWVKSAAAVEEELDRFRPSQMSKPALPAGKVLQDKIIAARNRLKDLEELKTLLASASDTTLGQARRFAATRGLEKDDTFLSLYQDAEKKIRSRAVYNVQNPPIPPVAFPDDNLPSLIFTPRLDRTPNRRLPGPSTTFFALARGVLYALDETDGSVLWTARVGLDAQSLPVRVPASDRHEEMALILTYQDGQTGLTARKLRDGRVLWFQPFKASGLGSPVVMGEYAFVPLADAEGTILEISLATGERVGQIQTGRPLGGSLALRPGTGLLYVPADAESIYVWNIDHHNADGERQSPAFVGVMTTGHPAGSLLNAPLFSNPDPESIGPKHLLLCQSDGLERMKLRAFPLTEGDAPASVSAVAEIPLRGWTTYSPRGDGEKLAMATDQGDFGLFGLGLTGNKDLPLFTLSAPSEVRADSGRPARSQVVAVEEGAVWLLTQGRLRKMQFGVNGSEGLQLVPRGEPLFLGEAIQEPQTNLLGDTIVVATQSGSSCRATALDGETGQVRWQRELGLLPKGDPLEVGNELLLLDQAGGIYRLDPTQLASEEQTSWRVDERWLLSSPLPGQFTPVSSLIAGPDQSAFVLLAGQTDKGTSLLLRRYASGRVDEQIVPAPALPVGTPILMGNKLVIPLTNGYLYRLSIPEGRILEEGPSWRSERATGTCYLAPLNENELIVSDGGKSLVRWRWEAQSKLFESRGRITLSDAVAATPVVLPGEQNRFALGDAKGNLTLWDGKQFAPPPMRRWTADEKAHYPPGAIREGLRLIPQEGSTPRIGMIKNNQLVAIGLDGDPWLGPVASRGLEGSWIQKGNLIWLADRSGHVQVLDALTGRPSGEDYQLPSSFSLSSTPTPLSKNRLLLPLSDGTIGISTVEKK